MKKPPRQLRDAEAVIAAVGCGRLVEITGHSHSNVGNQRRHGRLAHSGFLIVTAELARLGYWAKPELWGIVSPKKPAKRKA
jgi:hypothetical protein